MKIFISWSGVRSKRLALHLYEWLRAVVQRSDPWMSDRDLEAGQRWNDEISAQLKDSHFGIVCLTPENLQAPWLLFEAGALAKAVDVARVVPVLMGVRRADLTFPLAQFQAVDADQSGLRSLAFAINSALPDRLEPTTLDTIFTGLWPGLAAAIATIPPASVDAHHASHRPDHELLNELVEGLHQVQRTLAGGRGIEGAPQADSDDWEDYYVRGVNLANERGGRNTDLGALRAHTNAIALAPQSLPSNVRSRLYAYRAAMLKRLGRLEEAEHDLVLAQRWATEDNEIDDATYNLACVLAMGGTPERALPVLRRLMQRSSHWGQVVLSKPSYFQKLSSNAEFQAITGGGLTTG